MKQKFQDLLTRLLQKYKSAPKIGQILFVVGFGFIGVALTTLSLASTVSTTNITINGTKSGAEFDGIGAISGGGGNSRLLIDYPEPERSRILDYLFKPHYGANLQILKLEIGGDANSTDGSEASIEHSSGQINCNSGYEWWIAEQALQRNPSIKIYGLQWTAPGWTGDGTQTIWTQSNVNYVVDWMKCAQSHNIPVAYLGGWNERGNYNATWYESLRKALNENGYQSTQLIAADQINDPWGVASGMALNSVFNSSVSIVGVHDSCPADPTTGYSCTTTQTARNLGKPLWDSEIGGMDANTGAADMVRAINRGYNESGLTGYVQWPLIDSMPSGLPDENRGLLTADEPWSGNYQVNLMTWAIAQTAQFVNAGWVHVGGANQPLGVSGTYNTYQAPNHSAWSLVAENSSDYAGQTVVPRQISVTVSGGLPSSVVHVWATNLWIHSSSPQWFAHEADIHLSNRKFTYTIQPGYVVTFTTTTGQSKGTTSPPASTSLSIPYSNTLTADDGSDEPSLLSPQDGSFQLVNCDDGESGLCTQQMTPMEPVLWAANGQGTNYPYATIGGSNWANYAVSVRMLFTETNGSGGVIGRFSNRGGSIGGFDGYLLDVNENGNWRLLKNNSTATTTEPETLISGTISSLGVDKWHTISLGMNGSNLAASIDGNVVGVASDSSYSSGPAGIEAGAFTDNWPINQYQDFTVASDGLSPISIYPVTGVITSGISEKCLDDYRDEVGAKGRPNKVDVFSCNGSAAQKWTVEANGTIQINNQCLDIYQNGVKYGSKVDLYPCNGGKNQQWQIVGGDTIINPVSGTCLDDPQFSKIDGTQLDIWGCNGGKNQVWHILS